MNKYTIGAVILVVVMITFAMVCKSPTHYGKNINTDNKNKQVNNMENISSLYPQDFKSFWESDKQNGAVLIDVRTPAEYDAGHYQDSINIDYYSDSFRDELNKLDKNKKYYIYCRSGHRSGNALFIMQELGFSNVHDLAGGIASSPTLIPVVQ